MSLGSKASFWSFILVVSFWFTTVAQVFPEPSSSKHQGWPVEVKLKSPQQFRMVHRDELSGAVKYRSPHFEIWSEVEIPSSTMVDLALVFESTRLTLNQFFPKKISGAGEGKSLHLTRVYRDRESYFRAGGPSDTAGMYFRATREVWLPLESLGVKGPGPRIKRERFNAATLIHELTHQLSGQRQLPVWVSEGLADFVASAWTTSDRFSFRAPERRVVEYLQLYRGIKGKELSIPGPSQLFQLGESEFVADYLVSTLEFERKTNTNYAAALLLFTHFSNVPGEAVGHRWQQYFAALNDGMLEPQARLKYLVRGISPAELEEEVRTKWGRHGLRIRFSS